MSIVHLHLLLNHVPVVGMLFVLIILGVALWRRDSAGGKMGLWLLVGLAAVTALVFLTGEPAEEAVEKLAGVSDATIHPHEEAAEAALLATSIAGVLALAALLIYLRRELPRLVLSGAFALALVVSGLLGWTANLGGRIRHTEISGAAMQPRRDLDDDR